MRIHKAVLALASLALFAGSLGVKAEEDDVLLSDISAHQSLDNWGEMDTSDFIRNLIEADGPGTEADGPADSPSDDTPDSGVADPDDIDVVGSVSFTLTFGADYAAYAARTAEDDNPEIFDQLEFFVCSVNTRTYNLLTETADLPQRRCEIVDNEVTNVGGKVSVKVNVTFARWDQWVFLDQNLDEFEAGVTGDDSYDNAVAGAVAYGNHLRTTANVENIYKAIRGWLSIGGDYSTLAADGWSWVTGKGPSTTNDNDKAIFPYFVLGSVDTVISGGAKSNRRRLLFTEQDFEADRPTLDGGLDGFDEVALSDIYINNVPFTAKSDDDDDNVPLIVGLVVGLGGGLLLIGIIVIVVMRKNKSDVRPGGQQGNFGQPNVVMVQQPPASPPAPVAGQGKPLVLPY